MEVNFVGFADEPVAEDPQALISPQPQELVLGFEAVRRGHAQAVIDSWQVPKVKDVMELGRRRRHVLHRRAVNQTQPSE